MVISQELYIFLVTSSIIGLTFAIFSAILASYAAIKVVAMEKSTHQVQYIDPEIDRLNKEFMDEWATSDETIKKQDKLFAEDLEDQMPEFSPSDDDKEVFSF